ncbi:MAG TPA: agmatine deiminase family protein [Candidatus Sumerlaeota bacterium]|nr:agmatine deiminase family protein [Candidatus Sumerlaeota bacterium]
MEGHAPRPAPGSPAALGYRHPAEWERHAATWLAWPHNRRDWPGKFAPVQWVYAEIVRRLAPGERVRILVQDARHEALAASQLRRAGARLERVEFFQIETDRGWCRDMGPIFVVREQPAPRAAIADLHFNAWAKYANWRKDARVAGELARRLGMPRLDVRTADGRPFVLEGGAIDVNGAGVVLTTEECLLDPTTQVRNPGLTRDEVERALGDALEARQVVWLGRGIAGDDTHGHVDDLCRFVNPTTIVLCQEPDGADANHRPLAENRERLEGLRLADGEKAEVIALPMPEPLWFDGLRLPASYANFYIGNEVVLVPTFNDPRDREALGILGECFPTRTVVGIHAVDLVWGLGTLHCLTHEEPAV